MRTFATVLLCVAACNSSSATGAGVDAAHGSDDGGPASSDGGRLGTDGGSTTPQTTVFTILLENHDYAEIVGSTDAPYINSLITQYGLATNYKDTGHPSTPNYLHLISGDNQYPGVVDVLPTQAPYFPASAANLATQLEAASIPWRSYQDGESTPCDLSNDGNYAPKHDPFLYFMDQQDAAGGRCAATNVDMTSFAADLATNTYRYMWLTPNLIDDGHNPTSDPVGALTTSDTWLSTHVPAILASDAYQNGGVLFITWDEAEGRNGDDPDKIPMIIVSKRLVSAGYRSATAYTHSSYLATVEDLLGLSRLATVTSTPNMLEFLH